jgi:flagellin
MNIGNSFNTHTTNFINQNKTNTEETLSKIGAVRELSGKDNANLMIADSLSLQISTLTQEIQNSNETVGMMQIADSGVSNIAQSAEKLNELSVRNNSDSLNSDQKQMLQQEFQATKAVMQDIVETTSYNGKSVLSSEFNLQVTGLNELSIENQDGIADFKEGLDVLSSQIGSNTNQHEVSIANSLSAVSSLTSAYANVSEEPMDQKINDLEKNQIKLESSIIAQNHQTEMLQKRVSALLV